MNLQEDLTQITAWGGGAKQSISNSSLAGTLLFQPITGRSSLVKQTPEMEVCGVKLSVGLSSFLVAFEPSSWVE